MLEFARGDRHAGVLAHMRLEWSSKKQHPKTALAGISSAHDLQRTYMNEASGMLAMHFTLFPVVLCFCVMFDSRLVFA